MKNTGRRLPLKLQCSLYRDQQGDVSQSVRGNYISHVGTRDVKCRLNSATAVYSADQSAWHDWNTL